MVALALALNPPVVVWLVARLATSQRREAGFPPLQMRHPVQNRRELDLKDICVSKACKVRESCRERCRPKDAELPDLAMVRGRHVCSLSPTTSIHPIRPSLFRATSLSLVGGRAEMKPTKVRRYDKYMGQGEIAGTHLFTPSPSLQTQPLSGSFAYQTITAPPPLPSTDFGPDLRTFRGRTELSKVSLSFRACILSLGECGGFSYGFVRRVSEADGVSSA